MPRAGLPRPSLRCALDTVSVGRLLLGRVYPFVLGDVEKTVESVKELGLTAKDEKRGFSGHVEGYYHSE